MYWAEKNWPETEIPEAEVITRVRERTELVALGAAVGEVPLQQRLPAGIIAVVAAVDFGIDVKPLIPVSGVRSPAACIHIDITGLQGRPGIYRHLREGRSQIGTTIEPVACERYPVLRRFSGVDFGGGGRLKGRREDRALQRRDMGPVGRVDCKTCDRERRAN